MTLEKILWPLILFTTLLSCEPQVTFNEPQPHGVDNLSKFPNRLQGQYIGLDSESTFVISDNMILYISDYDSKIHIKQLDSNTVLSGDTITNLKTNEKTIVNRIGDTLIHHIHSIDTVFQLNYDHVIRKFKGYYFLSKRYNKEDWGVSKISLSSGQLIYSTISSEKEIESLKEMTEISKDTVQPHRFSATKKQFKEFIKEKGFSQSDTFFRIK